MTPTKLLVVDDEIDFAEFVSEIAQGMGFVVQTTNDSSDFATHYSIDTDIIVLDLFMPGTDGIELLRFLSDNKSRVSVVFISGGDKGVLHSAQELAYEQGINVLGTLQKPFRAVELEEILTKHHRPSSGLISGPDELPSIDELKLAIEHGDLFMVYQPQINIADRKLVGVEALVRWDHQSKGVISPGHFIPIAEENGLISDITSFVTNASIRQQGEWRKKHLDIRMSINLSPKVLDDLDLPEKMIACVREMGGNISNIVIEVTETALTSNIASYIDILARLRMKGFSLSIDDFGTGYSSLQQLVRVPFTELKVDQAFIRNLDTNEECRTIAEASILLAHKLGMKVVAEGIETESVWNILRDAGCDEGQGFWMGKPMPAEDIEAWMSNWSTN